MTHAAIPELLSEFQLTPNGERFLLLEKRVGEDDRMLIFATDQALRLLSKSEDWYDNRTFTLP